MSRERLTTILLAPHVTEKTSMAMANANQYAFRVDHRATKTDVKKAIEAIYGVTVVDVRTQGPNGERPALSAVLPAGADPDMQVSSGVGAEAGELCRGLTERRALVQPEQVGRSEHRADGSDDHERAERLHRQVTDVEIGRAHV